VTLEGAVALVGMAKTPVRVKSSLLDNQSFKAQRAAMNRHMLALGILGAAISAMALTGGTGVARADPDPFEPVEPFIDQILTETPDVFVDPGDAGGRSLDWGGTGMYCQNLFVRCH